MRYAVEMYFDKMTESVIWSYIRKIRDCKLSNRYYDWGVKPHVTLGVFNDIDEEKAKVILRKFAFEHNSLKAYLGSVGMFPDSGAICFAPIVTKELLELNGDLIDAMKELDPNPERWYTPGVWIPHCALGLELDKDNLSFAANIIIHDFEKLKGDFVSFSLVRVLEPSEEIEEFFFKKA